MNERVVRAAILVACAVACGGCSMIPVQMNTSMTVRHADGTVDHKETHWHGTLDQLPDQVAKTGSELASVTSTLVKELTDVPPPGHVTLGSLHSALGAFEGNPKADFLAQAKDNDGKPIPFTYVQLGVPSYDEFFRATQELYATLYQADQTVHRMRELTGKVLSGGASANANLKGRVDQALTKTGIDADVTANLQALQKMGGSLAGLTAKFAGNAVKLVSAGRALVVSAPTSLTNPKVVLHLDLIKQGLVDSVTVVEKSAGLLGTLAHDLSDFT